MSANDLNQGGAILPASPLARALDDYPVPPLRDGFADRVLAAAETRAAPLPELRRTAGGGGSGGRGWRMGRRIAVAAFGFGALATAAAATGLLERFDIPVPSPETVWASLTGKEAASAPVSVTTKPVAPAASAALAAVVIEGPIDTPEELGEAFRRIDEVRQSRSAARRQIIDQRIDRALERRRTAGLPMPDPAQEARLRARIDEAQTRREALAAEQIAQRREQLRQRVENGEALTRENLIPNRQPGTEAPPPRARLRDLSQQERREFLRSLPPEDRRVVIEEYRRRREARQGQQRLQPPPQDQSSGQGPSPIEPGAAAPVTAPAEPVAQPQF